jgi:hypothetical protein
LLTVLLQDLADRFSEAGATREPRLQPARIGGDCLAWTPERLRDPAEAGGHVPLPDRAKIIVGLEPLQEIGEREGARRQKRRRHV